LIANLSSPLEDDKSSVRGYSDKILRQIAGSSAGFEADASESRRKAAIAKWEKWWAQTRGAGAAQPTAPSPPARTK
jgi:hypothetical protein